ncbi:MAG: hypothetical protein JST46_18790 [Bacteroidetes bacterium]|nr:hypothetical protein [Bacteroidota bacterium]
MERSVTILLLFLIARTGVGQPLEFDLNRPMKAQAKWDNVYIYKDPQKKITIGVLEGRQSVDILRWRPHLFFIEAKTGEFGYVNSEEIISYQDEFDSLIKYIEKKTRDIESGIAKKYAESLDSKFGKDISAKILKHEYWIGMTDEMAVYALGKPDKINSTVTATVRSEQWVYVSRDIYLYFKNGILESYQNSR